MTNVKTQLGESGPAPTLAEVTERPAPPASATTARVNEAALNPRHGEPPALTPIALACLGERGMLGTYELRAELRERIGSAALVAAPSDEALVRLARPHFESRAADDMDGFCDAVLQRVEAEFEYPHRVPLVKKFVHHVMGFRVLPAEKRQELLDRALRDLAQLEELISFYEKLRAVAEFRRGDRPRNHEAKMYVDFYECCLVERAAITRYVTNGVDAEAIRRSDEVDELRSAFSGLVSAFAEVPPYRLRSPRGDEHLDVRKINRWRHRVRPLPIRRGHELGAKYESGDIRGFYDDLGRERSSASLFAIIENAVRTVPKLTDRAPNFTELRELHDAAKWRGFYALALPQIEGLFAEMGEIARPGKTNPHAALPTKVGFIRQYAEVHEHSLDYFEYILPMERNCFSHSGRLDDAQLRALELLFDLAFVCELYTEITSPVIELLKLLARDDLRERCDIHQWAGIFELVDKIEEAEQMHEVKDPLRSFMRAHLPDDKTKRAAANELADALGKAAAYAREQMLSTVRERLGVEFYLGAKKKTAAVATNAACILDLIDELDALDRGFLMSLMLRPVMQGMQEHGELPDDAREKLAAALAAEAQTFANLDSIIELGKKARL